MNIVLFAARLLLVGVFSLAGLAKLADRAGSRQALIDFGVPARLAAPLGLLLPLAELAVAAALVPVATAWWGALGALALLLLFLAGIGLSLARRRRPDCHCFGQLHSEPVGPATLARNAALAAVAAFVVWWGRDDLGPSVGGWLGTLSAAQVAVLLLGLVALGLLLLEGWFLLHLLRQQGRLLLRIEVLEARLGMVPVLSPNGSAAVLPQGLPVGA
jgi:hypothetical protein